MLTSSCLKPVLDQMETIFIFVIRNLIVCAGMIFNMADRANNTI